MRRTTSRREKRKGVVVQYNMVLQQKILDSSGGFLSTACVIMTSEFTLE